MTEPEANRFLLIRYSAHACGGKLPKRKSGTKLVIDRATPKLWQALCVLIPAAIHCLHGFRKAVPFPVLIWLLLPNSIRPRPLVRLCMFSSSKIVAQTVFSAAQRFGPCPGSKLVRIEAEGHATVIKMGMPRPLRPGRAVRYTVCRTGAECDVHVRACVSKDIFHATQRRTVLAVFGPYECLGCLHVSKLAAVLVPSPPSWVANIASCSVPPSLVGRKEDGWLRQSNTGHFLEVVGELRERSRLGMLPMYRTFDGVLLPDVCLSGLQR